MIPYADFLAKPYVYRVKSRTLENPPVDIVENTKEFVENLRDIKAQRENPKNDKIGKEVNFQESLTEKLMINNLTALYLSYINVLRVNPQSRRFRTQDLDTNHPHVFNKAHSLGEGFMIRTETSKDIMRSTD